MAFLRITHPDLENGAVVNERAFVHLRRRGWVLATDGQPGIEAAVTAIEVPKPQKNDSTAEWRAYAIQAGMPAEQAEAMGRDDLAHYYNPTPVTSEES